MARYRYLLGSLLHAGTVSEIIAEVPFEDATYTHVLNGPGSFQGSLGLIQPPKVHQVLAGALELGRLTLYVERDGVIVWSGILWTAEDSIEHGTRTLRGEGWLSYFRRRSLRAQKVYVQVEQVTIAVDLLNYAQGHPAGDLNIVTGPQPATGILRDQVYQADERVWIGESIEQLAGVEHGFDFRFDSRWRLDGLGGRLIETRFLTQYPATGRATDLVFDLGSQLESMKVTADATKLVTHVDVIGTAAGEEEEDPVVTVAAADLIGVYPLLDDVESHTDITERATLEAHGRRRLARGRAPITIPSVDVSPDDPPVGTYLPGDIVTVRGGVGLAALDGPFRIIEYSVRVDQAGSEIVTPQFANLDLYAA